MRKVPEKERFVQIGISFSKTLLSQIDEIKDRESRSSFVRRMLRDTVENKEKLKRFLEASRR